jgi:hypothetical protein
MLVSDDAIRENIQLSFYQTGKQQLHEKTTLNVPRVVFSCTPGASLGSSSRHWGRVISKQGGALSGEGRFLEGRSQRR